MGATRRVEAERAASPPVHTTKCAPPAGRCATRPIPLDVPLAVAGRTTLVFFCIWATAFAAPSPELRFVRDGTEVRRIDLPTLRQRCTPRTVTLDDPYY